MAGSASGCKGGLDPIRRGANARLSTMMNMLKDTTAMIRLGLGLFVWILASHVCFGQAETGAFLFDQTENGYCSEELVARMDTFLAELSKTPSSNGVIIFEGKSNDEGRNLTYFHILESHTKQRQFDPARISYVRAANGNKMVMYYWIVPNGAQAPKPASPFRAEPISSPVHFETAWADWRKFAGTEWTIYSNSFADWGCEANPNMRAFAEILRSNPHLVGYVIIYTKFGARRSRANKVSSFAIKELTREYKVPKAQLRTIFGGGRAEPQMELWFVPKGQRLPVN